LFANPKGEKEKYEQLLGPAYNIVEIDTFTTMGTLRNEILAHYSE